MREGSRTWILWRALLVLALAGAVATTRCEGGDAVDTDPQRPAGATSTTVPRTTSAPPTSMPSITTAPVSPTITAPVAATADRDPGAAFEQLQRLPLADPDPHLPAYRREAFGDGWDYDPATGCNTRELVLIDEAVRPPLVDDRCRSTEARWVSLYDGVHVDSVAELQIDHLVPLAEAWRSGAAAWSPDRREAFANDLTHPDSLIAVSSFTNQSKGDSTPDRWMPPDADAWCTYAEMWVGVKARWGLSVTEAEHGALTSVLVTC